MLSNTLPEEFIKGLHIIEELEAAGFEAYFVGGSVRDYLLNRPIHDVDIATSAYPEEVKQVFSQTIDVGIEHEPFLSFLIMVSMRSLRFERSRPIKIFDVQMRLPLFEA